MTTYEAIIVSLQSNLVTIRDREYMKTIGAVGQRICPYIPKILL